nr:MAG TPA: hypothetical protein [Caudoviricetes sp.]
MSPCCHSKRLLTAAYEVNLLSPLSPPQYAQPGPRSSQPQHVLFLTNSHTTKKKQHPKQQQ